MSAFIAGNDLLAPLLDVSRGRPPTSHTLSAGVRTHLSLQALLGCAALSGSRRDVLRECWRLMTRRGPYRGSEEEFTPWRWDWPSVVPLWFAAAWLILNPRAAETMPQRGWGAHLLNRDSIGRIEAMARR
jgi:hypothetical protein